MNVRQKIGLGIVAPLFAFAVGHTIYNKISTNKNDANRTIQTMSELQKALNAKSESDTTLFKAQQLLKDINNEVNYGKNISRRDIEEQYDIEQNCVECGD